MRVSGGTGRGHKGNTRFAVLFIQEDGSSVQAAAELPEKGVVVTLWERELAQSRGGVLMGWHCVSLATAQLPVAHTARGFRNDIQHITGEGGYNKVHTKPRLMENLSTWEKKIKVND